MRWVFRIIGGVGVFVLVVAGLLFLLPGDKIARIAAEQVKAQTGRDLTFEGEVSVTFWPVLGIETGPVTLSNADWAGPEPMLQADSLSIGVAAPDLLRGAIRVTGIIANAPDLRLQTGASGRGNWEFGTAAASGAPATTEAETGAPQESTPVTLERLSLKQARLTYLADGADPLVLDGVDFALDWPHANGPADIRATRHSGSDRVQVVAHFSGFAQFLAGAVVPVTAQITAPAGEAEFSGRASIDGAATGHLAAGSSDTARTLAALGVAGIEVPYGLGQSIDIVAEATFTADGRVSLRDLSLDLDGNAMSGAADVVLSDPVQVTAQLTAGALDFSQVGEKATSSGGTTSGGAEATPAASGWSTEPIDASALGLADGSLRLTAQSIRTPDVRLGVTQVKLRVDQSRAVMDLGQVAVFGGSVSGQLVANNRRGFSVRGALRASDIDVQQALQTMAGIERISGSASGTLEFLGVGGSMDAIMRSVGGDGSLSIGQGVIAGFDLDKLMETGTGSGGTTVFDSLTATFTMQGGNMANEDLLLLLDNYRADGAGRIGLGARDIDYLFTPVALRANSGEGLAIPVRIIGPWADPSIRPDLKAALEAAADVKLDELEQQAKDEVQRKLVDELDVHVEEGQNPEEALKDTLEDEAKKGLLKLLGQD